MMHADIPRTKRTLTGWHILAMFVGGFSIIVAVNLLLAYSAVRTFPGLETDSSYVASQSFNADRAAQDALGWDVRLEYGDGQLDLWIVGPDWRAVQPEIISTTLGRATNVASDSAPDFVWTGTHLRAPADLATGNWNLRVDLRAADGTAFRRRIPLHVRP